MLCVYILICDLVYFGVHVYVAPPLLPAFVLFSANFDAHLFSIVFLVVRYWSMYLYSIRGY